MRRTWHRRALVVSVLAVACSRPDEDRPPAPHAPLPPAASASAAAGPSAAPAPTGTDTLTNSAPVERVAATRPPTWAEPVKAGAHLPNLYRVSPTLYRGAQPEDEGFAELKALGIKTVVNLRSFNSDRSETEEHGLGYVHITQQAWEAEDEEVLEFLRVAIDPKRQPVFVHCQHGADRTGTSVAAYRIVVQGWSKEEALREMTEGGYGFHSVWTNLVRYVEGLDVEKMRRELGIKAPKPAASR